MQDHLPFCRVDDYPAHVNGSAVLARLFDGLGFRFHWATEGLNAEDYAFSPGQGSQSIGQLVRHIWGLINWMSIAVLGQGEDCPTEPGRQRARALHMLNRLRENCATLDDQELSAVTIDDLPFWHILNGPLADALTHVGQINAWRRLAGNPTPKARLFTCEPPGTKKP
jgi:hypothetical protein